MTIEELIAREGSQAKAAHHLGITLSTLRRWMAGKKVSPMGLAILKRFKIEAPRVLAVPEVAPAVSSELPPEGV